MVAAPDGEVPEWIAYHPVTPPPAENPGAAFWKFEETAVGETVSTVPDAIRDRHPDGHNLHLTASGAFPVVAGAPAFGNGRALSLSANGGARILDNASANRFDFGPTGFNLTGGPEDDDDGDGLTWSPATKITGTTKQAGWTWYATGPGAGIRLTCGNQAGRLIVACDHIRTDQASTTP